MRRCRAVLRLAVFRRPPRCTLREGHRAYQDHMARLRLPGRRLRYALVTWRRRYAVIYRAESLGDYPPWQRTEDARR